MNRQGGQKKFVGLKGSVADFSDGRVFLLVLGWYFQLFFKISSGYLLFGPKEGHIISHDKKCLANVPYIALRSSQPI